MSAVGSILTHFFFHLTEENGTGFLLMRTVEITETAIIPQCAKFVRAILVNLSALIIPLSFEPDEAWKGSASGRKGLL